MEAVERVQLLQQQLHKIQLQVLINIMVAQAAAVGVAMLTAQLLDQSMV